MRGGRKTEVGGRGGRTEMGGGMRDEEVEGGRGEVREADKVISGGV